MQYIVLAMIGGLAAGLSNYTIEYLGFRLCAFMERQGQMKRLAPGTWRLYMVYAWVALTPSCVTCMQHTSPHITHHPGCIC